MAQAANATVEQAADWWRKNGPAFQQAFVDRWSRVDWKALAEKDPAEVAALMQQRQEEETLLAEATRRGEADIAAAQEQAEQELEEARRSSSAKLAAKLPELFGPAGRASAPRTTCAASCSPRASPADRIAGIYEAPIIELALNAMRFENAQALARRVRQRIKVDGEAARSGQRPAKTTPARVAPGPANLARQPTRADAVRQVGERFSRAEAPRSPTRPSSSV